MKRSIALFIMAILFSLLALSAIASTEIIIHHEGHDTAPYENNDSSSISPFAICTNHNWRRVHMVITASNGYTEVYWNEQCTICGKLRYSSWNK